MKLISTFILLFISSCCFAQKADVYFLRNDGKYTFQRDSADYFRLVSEPDSGSTLYNVSELYKNGNKKLLGKSSTIDPPRYEGSCATFYSNGKRKSLCNYKNGHLSGTFYEFYPNGKLYLELKYPENGDEYNDLKDNYQVITNYDSTGTALTTVGNGIYKRYNDGFKQIIESGNVKNGYRDGEFTGSAFDQKSHYVEKYDNGILITGTITDENGTVTTYTKSRATEPQYKGGLSSFYKYLSRKIIYPEGDRDKNIQGSVIMSFVVEKDGKISDIKILKSVSHDIDQEAIWVVKNSPNWVPGTQFGRAVRTVYMMPITFALN